MSIEAMKLALEALEECALMIEWEWGDCRFEEVMRETGKYTRETTPAITALRQAIEQAEKQEPVAHLWQHSETGRTRIVMPDQIITADANWIVVGPLYLATPPRRHPRTRRTEMTDRELLEQAAKAAGYSPNPNYLKKTNQLLWRSESGFPATWSPLTDDGDALRLAVKLNLSADFFDDAIFVGYTPNDNECDQVIESVGNDPNAATRRAIVRAAAEIGRSMK